MPQKHSLGRNSLKYFDYTLLFIIIFLIGFGLVMLYSVSAYEAQSVFGNAAFYLKKQGRSVIVGLVAMLFVASVPYEFWKKFATPIYVLSFILCIAVIFAGTDANNSTRWLSLGPISFQPSELAKIAVIILMAKLLSSMPKQIGKFKELIKVLMVAVFMCVVIAKSNLSTAIIVGGIAVIMAFVTSPKYSHFVAIIVAGLVLVFAFIALQSYRGDRIKAWLHPELYPDDAYQTLQGLYAIGSGGLLGKGLGGSIQKLGYVPEAQNDFIFSIICEELGLFGAICAILLFALLIWRFMVIANNAPDLFSSLLVTGVLAHIALQVIFNIAVVTNSMPNTGITLPFISYGGTSLIILMAEMGLVMGVSRRISLKTDMPRK